MAAAVQKGGRTTSQHDPLDRPKVGGAGDCKHPQQVRPSRVSRRAALKRGGGSGNPWITGTYDPVLKMTYWGASQAKPWHRKSRGEKDGMSLLYTDSMLAMDVATGKLAWYHQFIPGESFDIDEHYEFINVDIPGYAHKSGFEMGKAGVLWHLDRQTGQLIRAMDTGLDITVTTDTRLSMV